LEICLSDCIYIYIYIFFFFESVFIYRSVQRRYRRGHVNYYVLCSGMYGELNKSELANYGRHAVRVWGWSLCGSGLGSGLTDG